jgi:hypothetical protein
MTPQEFKAWFEGFTEAFAGVPTKAQWARVKERVGEIDGKPVTERIYLDRYWNYPRPYWDNYPHWTTFNTTCGSVGTATSANLAATGTSYKTAISQVGHASNFDSGSAMLALGRADAQALAS